ncbi:MAG: acetyltransferase [Nitriliruptoraceae bacterium]
MQTQRRVIVGAGGFGREVRALLSLDPALEVVGYLDDRAPDPAGPPLGAGYLGPIASDAYPDVPAVVAVGYPRPRHAVLAALEAAGRPLAPPVVHPRAELGGDVHLADGVIITAGVGATTAVQLGRCTTVHPGAQLGHDVVAEELVAVLPGAVVSGAVHLGAGVLVGANATILQGVQVGAWATIGAGAVVTRNVAPGATVVGVPARALPAKDEVSGERTATRVTDDTPWAG